MDPRARADLLAALAALASDDESAGDALRAIVESMPARLSVIDPSAVFLWTNHPHSKVLGHSMFEYMPEPDHAQARAAIERVLQSGRADRFSGHGPGNRGPHSRYESWIAPIGSPIIALALISRDVSEEWELYDELRDREQRLSLVLRAAGMGMWRFDLRTHTVEFDEAARAIYGFTVSRMDSLTFTTNHIHPDDRAEADRKALESARTRIPYSAQNRIIRTDGQQRWVEVTGSPILDEAGQLVAIMGTITDITERREVEARARQAQRLDAVGSLTAGIAHNFNNMLAAIMPTLSMIEGDVSPISAPLVRGASLATERAAQLVRQLMTFAGRNGNRLRTVEAPGPLVERTVALCRSTFDRVIELRVTIEPELPAICVDVGQIEQALLNLLLNARDAVADATPPIIQVRVTHASEREIQIVVEDNGPGVPEELRERIFDPFFTTKHVGAGTGLGLATAYAIAREHGGAISCGGESGRGAQFTMTIPGVDLAPTVADPVVRGRGRAQGTVLVVDDDAIVRETVARVLRDAGFTIHTADSADQAIIVLGRQPGVDAVLLDLNMPGSSWRTVVRTLRQDHPKARVVAFTGGVTARDNSVDGWLIKPAHPDAIIDAINQVIVRA
ncbi:MAG TPA: PAS domain S-box protein [Kofleriaceae bacterium]|nr:PAS domain S-box protein [Kofleriaceae bacterium]